MYFNYHKSFLLHLLKRLGPLTCVQVQYYLSLMTGDSPEEITHALKVMDEKEIVNISSKMVGIGSYPEINRKMIIAFWVYIQYSKQAQERYFKAEYPATMGFVTDEVYVIIICENPKYDKDLIALKAAEQNENIKYIIVGVNFGLDEIEKNMLPSGEYIFIQFSIRDILTDIPKLRQFKREKEENDYQGNQ